MRVHRLFGPIRERLRRSLLIQSILGGLRVFPVRSWLGFVLMAKAEGRLLRHRAAVALTVRRFEGQTVHVRPRTSDWETVHTSLLGGYHLPPAELAPVRTILDLGANIGVTVADLAARYPDARILGVELDAENLRMARWNTMRWADRAELLHGAVWTGDGRIAYGGNNGEHGYRVIEAMAADASATAIDEVPAYSMHSLIDRVAPGASVDYVKMDVEGTERFVLAQISDWAERVRCIKVEVHQPFDVAACARELQRLGFETVPDPSGINCVIGHR